MKLPLLVTATVISLGLMEPAVFAQSGVPSSSSIDRQLSLCSENAGTKVTRALALFDPVNAQAVPLERRRRIIDEAVRAVDDDLISKYTLYFERLCRLTSTIELDPSSYYPNDLPATRGINSIFCQPVVPYANDSTAALVSMRGPNSELATLAREANTLSHCRQLITQLTPTRERTRFARQNEIRYSLSPGGTLTVALHGGRNIQPTCSRTRNQIVLNLGTSCVLRRSGVLRVVNGRIAIGVDDGADGSFWSQVAEEEPAVEVLNSPGVSIGK